MFELITFEQFAQTAGTILDFMGITIIMAGVFMATFYAFVHYVQKRGVHKLYQSYRRNLARSILIGLEFIVAGDIIRSVAGNLSLNGVIILAIIILVRSFLGMEFEMEIEGRWPWQKSKSSNTSKN